MSERELLEQILDKVAGVDNRMSSIDSRMGDLEERMVNVETSLTGLEERVFNVENELVGLKDNLNDRSDDNVNDRFDELLKGKLSDILNDQLSDHTRLLEVLENRTNLMSVTIVKTQEESTYLTGKVENINTLIKTIKDYIDFQTYKLGIFERELYHGKQAG